MDKYYQTRRAQVRRYCLRTGSGQYPKRRWSDEEDCKVLAHSVSDRQLSKQIRRSVEAIQIRRCKLKKIMMNR